MNKKKLVMVLGAVSILTLSMVGCSDNKETSGTQSTSQAQESDQSEEKEFKYYTAEQLKDSIEKNEDIYLLDIQVEEEWDKHHIKGAVQTNAYPVKSDEEKAKLDPVIPEIKGSDKPVVIVCPGGAGGAERTQAYLIEKGVDKDRLFILENGQSKWPYDELLEK